MICLVLVPLALWLGENGLERALLISSLMLVLLIELLNTAVEVVVNRIGPERHELSGLAKDLGSAAVLLSLLHAGVVWVLVVLT
jgi:diacylglycerol kinase (ATP)